MSSAINNLLGRFSTGSNSLNNLNNALGGKFKFKNLTYPDDINNIGGGINHAMVFNIFVRQTSKSAQTRPLSGQTLNNITSGGLINSLAGNARDLAQKVLPGAVTNAIGNGVDTIINNMVGLSESIVLYIPHDLVTNESQWWSAESFKDIGYLAQSSDVADLLVKSGVNMGTGLAKRILGRLGSEASSEIQNAASKVTGRIVNPYYELLYQGTSFRSFFYKFKFTPQTAKEAQQVRDIIRTFRYHQAPEIDDTLAGRFLLYPSEFRIQYMSYGKENEFINKVGRCVLTDVTTSYAEGAAAFHNDGSPISYTLSLKFQELEIVTKEKIGLPGEDLTGNMGL